MNDHRNNEHFKQRRKEIEMYNAGVDSGIRFAVEKILQYLWYEDLAKIIDQLIKEYHE